MQLKRELSYAGVFMARAEQDSRNRRTGPCGFLAIAVADLAGILGAHSFLKITPDPAPFGRENSESPASPFLYAIRVASNETNLSNFSIFGGKILLNFEI